MTDPLDGTTDFGDFDFKVKVFKRYVTFGNVLARNLIIKSKEDCDCWVDIPSDYKKFTTADLATLGTHKYSADMFETLVELSKGTKDSDAKRAKDAQAALTDLAPAGKTWQQYRDMIDQTYEQNKEAVKAKINENHNWLLDDLYKDFKNANLNGTLDADKLKQLATDIKTVRGFSRLVTNAKFCAAHEDIIDPATGNPVLNANGQAKQQYTASAKHGQEILGKLSATGNWKDLYNAIFNVELAQRPVYMPLLEQVYKQDLEKAKLSSLNLPRIHAEGVSLHAEELAVADQKTASVALNQRGVLIAANDEALLLPTATKEVLHAKRSTGIAA